MKGRIKYNVMSEKELCLFIDRMERLLTERGVEIDHEEMRKEMEAAGAKVEGNKVYFTREMISQAVANVPKEFTLYAPVEKNNVCFPHPHDSFYTRTCTGAPNYLPVEGEKHYITLDDTTEWFRVANEMENVDYVALPSTCDNEIPAEVIDIYTLEKALQMLEKHIWIQPYEGANTKYLIEMCQARAGGAEAMRERPIASFISCSVPVLKYKNMDAEIIYECAKAGIPVQPCSLPTAGANTPVTAQGTALAACAEVLAQIVMLETLCPGLPVIATPLLFSMDMKTTYILQSNVQITLGRLICMQAFEQGYGIHCHSYGTGSDSMLLDEQNMIERTSLIQAMAMSDASVLGGAGQLETAKTISPLALIMDNEIFASAKLLRQGLVIDDESLDFEELIGGKDDNGYLMSMHTMSHFHDVYRPELFYLGNRRGKNEEERTALERAREKYDEIMTHPMPEMLTDEQKKEIHEIVLRAEKELIK